MTIQRMSDGSLRVKDAAKTKKASVKDAVGSSEVAQVSSLLAGMLGDIKRAIDGQKEISRIYRARKEFVSDDIALVERSVDKILQACRKADALLKKMDKESTF